MSSHDVTMNAIACKAADITLAEVGSGVAKKIMLDKSPIARLLQHRSRLQGQHSAAIRHSLLAKTPQYVYRQRVVARTREDMHGYDLFADRILASEARAGCRHRPLEAFSDSVDRANTPDP
jgi:hypothetical protein